MNIFVLDYNINNCVEYTCDKHVVKMILETAQLLCTPFENGTAPYRRTHYNHPCSLWTRKTDSNYKWLIEYGLKLSDEYTFRYNKTHKSKKVILWCEHNMNKLSLTKQDLTPFAQAMPNQYKDKNVINAYRKYYINEKKHIAKWSKRDVPYWFL